MTTALIIGYGAAAASAALALSDRENLKIAVIDIALQLEIDRAQLIEALAPSSPDDWDEQTIELISKQPVASRNSGIPEKRIFGSDYPRSGEFMRLRLPFRADSLLGLIHTALSLIRGDQLARLGITLRAFTARGSTVAFGAH
jgi:hypothetical protein